MCTIIGSPGEHCILIILFQLYGPKTGLFQGNYFWAGQYDSSNLHIGRKTIPIFT